MATRIRKNNEGMKLFNDSVHGSIELDARLVRHIIDTPEFQRLRRIKQLGGVYYVYPGAQHNRFEHSLGTAHLAGKLARHLQKLHGEKVVTDRDVRCLEIAGLCHDLGHGPFSHLFDGEFMKTLGAKKWKHEEGSCMLILRILNEDVLGKLDLTAVDRDLIKEMILPPAESSCGNRTRGKSFLFEIISNKETGVDVDKWDYFARDCHHLGVPNGFDHNRFIRCTRLIADDNGERHICVRDKEVFNLYEMFHTRFMLHRRAYQHKSANAVEHMVCDAMVAANDAVRIYDGECGCKISECVTNTEAFLNLDDGILKVISNWNESNDSNVSKLEEAKKLLTRLEHGNRYKCVGNKILGYDHKDLEENEIKQSLEASCLGLKDTLKVSIISINYGSKGKNPIHEFRFYRKENLETFKIEKEEVSMLLPDVFEEKWVQVFCKDITLIEMAKQAFSDWYVGFKPRATDRLKCICVNLEQTAENKEIAEKILRLLTSAGE